MCIIHLLVLSGQCTHLSVIRLSSCEKGVEGVVGGEDEASQVDKQLAGDVEEDQEGVDSSQTKDDVHLGDGSLALEVVEDRVLGELYRDLVSCVFSAKTKHESDNKLADDRKVRYKNLLFRATK